MDYQGNYFPDDVDERESKTYRAIKKTFKFILYGLSLVVWILVIYFLIVNREKDIIKKNYMTEIAGYSDIDSDNIALKRINPREFMTEDGSIQVYNVDYASELGLLEMGIRFNGNKLTDGSTDDVLEYVLKDSEGNVYEMVNKKTDSGGRYGYARVCFAGLDIDLSSNDIEIEKRLSSEAMAKTENEPEKYSEQLKKLKDEYVPETDISYTLGVYYKRPTDSGISQELLYEFLIYNNHAVFYSADYNKG